MHRDPPATGAPAVPHDENVHHRARLPPQIPQRRGTAVAEHRAIPGREHRREPVALGTQDGVADGVDVAVEQDQPPGPQAIVDLLRSSAERKELRPADDAEVPRRESGDALVQRQRDGLTGHSPVNRLALPHTVRTRAPDPQDGLRHPPQSAPRRRERPDE